MTKTCTYRKIDCTFKFQWHKSFYKSLTKKPLIFETIYFLLKEVDVHASNWSFVLVLPISRVSFLSLSLSISLLSSSFSRRSVHLPGKFSKFSRKISRPSPSRFSREKAFEPSKDLSRIGFISIFELTEVNNLSRDFRSLVWYDREWNSLDFDVSSKSLSLKPKLLVVSEEEKREKR